VLTVFLATRNRADVLARALKAFAALESPPSGWKLVVVDNGSSDRTPAVLDEYRHRLPLVPVHEPTLGKNAALNTGLAQLHGDLAVFTDVDVLPRPDWLVQ
jgi:glycosyltransferase involved in cell wall biosynthesis